VTPRRLWSATLLYQCQLQSVAVSGECALFCVSERSEWRRLHWNRINAANIPSRW